VIPRVIGAESVVLSLTKLKSSVIQNVSEAVYLSGVALQRRVVQQKLRGQVLKRRTGRLAGSIALDPQDRARVSGTTVSIQVGTNVKYGIAWELGAVIPPHIIQARYAKALFWKGAKHPVRQVNMPGRTMQPRPFLRPALEELRPLIRQKIQAAIARGMKSP
jgi:hypothetical protein